jgi:hypothetical protein
MQLNAASILGLLGFLAAGLVVALVLVTWYTVRVLTRPYRRTYASALARGKPGDPGRPPAARGRSRRGSTIRRGCGCPCGTSWGMTPPGPR